MSTFISCVLVFSPLFAIIAGGVVVDRMSKERMMKVSKWFGFGNGGGDE